MSLANTPLVTDTQRFVLAALRRSPGAMTSQEVAAAMPACGWTPGNANRSGVPSPPNSDLRALEVNGWTRLVGRRSSKALVWALTDVGWDVADEAIRDLTDCGLLRSQPVAIYGDLKPGDVIHVNGVEDALDGVPGDDRPLTFRFSTRGDADLGVMVYAFMDGDGNDRLLYRRPGDPVALGVPE